jgi:dihydrofolate reductase
MDKPVYIVVAADQNRGIGIDGELPWRLKDDMRFFKEVTTKTKDKDKQNMVIMGRTTWESIPEDHRPLSGRKNVILTRNPSYPVDGSLRAASLHEAIEMADDSIETCYIIGGGSVYQQIINDPLLTGIYLTRIKKIYKCDTFFPSIPEKFSKVTNLGEREEEGIKYEYLLYEKEE